MSIALDRQIRPIYDSLDTGANKSAIVGCNKLLKKHPKNALVQALKALALVRSQKVEEALALCDEVLEYKPTDDATLNAMMHVLRGLGRHKDMITMYEAAYKKQPANEELGAQTFFANVRANNWKSAQQVASKMYKQFQEDRYLYWSAISTVLQANDPNTAAEMRTLLYKLALRLITSSPASSHVHPDRFHLHLTILRELREFDEAMALLETPNGQNICQTNLACNEIRRDIMRLRGALEDEGRRAEQRILNKNDRNWLEFLSVVDGTFSHLTVSKPSEDAREQCLSKVSNTLALFTKISVQDGKKDRSGLLGLLELESRSRKHGISTDPTRMVQLLKQYFETFGDKACCYEDLKPYVSLEGGDLAAWTEFLKASPPPLSTTENVKRVINTHKLLRYNLSASELTVEAESSRAVLYIEQYLEGLPLGKDLPVTELQHVDDFAILAASVFVNIWKLNGDIKYLYNAVVLLEFALSQSKQAFQMRLMLIRIYRLLGSPSVALEHYRLLGIKQVQNDTLSHFILSRASTFSLAASGDLTLSTECVESSQIYISNSQETSDFVIRAFSGEKYSQIPQFILFENWLDNSLQRDIVKLEYLRMRITHEVISSEVIDLELIELKFVFDRIHHDNRDLEIIPNYQPRDVESFNAQTMMFEKSEGHGWVWSFLKSYIKAFSQASDLDDVVEEKLLVGDRPQAAGPAKTGTLKERLAIREKEELAELTSDELSLISYADALAEWLEPFHDHVRPPASVVLAEAAKQTELKTGMPLKGVDITPPNGHVKKEEDTPPITEAPEDLVKFFENMKARFETVENAESPNEALHVATLTQEAFLLFVIETLRFKSASVVKIHKLGNLVAKFKPIRAIAAGILKDMAGSLEKMSALEGTSEKRRDFVSACMLPSSQMDDDFQMNIAKKVTDSRKKVEEGVAKGLMRLCSTYEQ
ncbi:N-acetyltransferase B complex non catalytic subunit-domain-containing protein [Rhodocollybia butyracea]|uniref:N-acetyltransferase B complex non catalytic subunit-domain-containing protein n=1 Tax=Rhodocollybia butyracea TaxID=206335 RepID=A0A9P5Q6B0_9AGAR|nr:N-acetyltransferase B complex non catalytic subunit-domain-containing protein [Rhodocollybia butyracea]